MRVSIKHKLLTAVLLAVVLPFAGFGWFLERAIVDDLSWQFVRSSLLGMARDLAEQVDERLAAQVEDLDLWAREPLAAWALAEHGGDGVAPFGGADLLAVARAQDPIDGGAPMRRALAENFDRYLSIKGRLQLLLLLDVRGQPVVASTLEPGGGRADPARLAALLERNYAEEPWFQEALGGGLGRVDHHQSPLIYPNGTDHLAPSADLYSVGLALAVPDHLDPEAVAGVLFALVSWRAFQHLIDAPVVKDVFRGLAEDGDPSPYAWIWSADGERILAHADPSLYSARLADAPIGLPAMVEDVNRRTADGELFEGGLYRPYTFRGKAKNAAFHRSAPESSLGFHWVVGVGIDDDDVERATAGLSRLLFRGTAVVLLVVVLWVSVIARRTSEPILALEAHTRRVAAGDLRARIEIPGRDELADLARAFNAMTVDLARQREELVRAEKDAAWREMARQVAHDIKGPLTPMRLSVDLLERSLGEAPGPAREERVRRTLDMMRRQVDALRDIASDFYHFTGGARSRPERFDLCALVRESLDLFRAAAAESGVAVQVQGAAELWVDLDRGKLRRVLVNLVSNALQAMEAGGELRVCVSREGARAVVELWDRGLGLAPEVRARLFEPYFTTRSEGTGLGLAIAWRTLEEMGGGIELQDRPDGERGTLARLWVPIP